MREIIFRGKSKENGAWVYGTPVSSLERLYGLNYSKRIVMFPESSLVIADENDDFVFVSELTADWSKRGIFTFSDAVPIEVIPETVGQFTGLYDLCGNRVFEGDILKYRHFDGRLDELTAIIKYGKFNCSCCHGVYGWTSEGDDCIRELLTEPVPKSGFCCYMVVGNIYDNPELVKEVDR